MWLWYVPSGHTVQSSVATVLPFLVATPPDVYVVNPDESRPVQVKPVAVADATVQAWLLISVIPETPVMVTIAPSVNELAAVTTADVALVMAVMVAVGMYWPSGQADDLQLLAPVWSW
jgi:hypothetical protein